MSASERGLAVALRALLLAVVPLLEELPNTCGDSRYFDLEDLPDRLVGGMKSGAPKRLQRLLLRCARRLIETDRSDESVRNPRKLMRDLTGVWLGLYFLGTPFPHPWEPVARYAERHGYDRDGGIFKAAGDVYRSARRALQPSGGGRVARPPLMVLDLGPLAYRQVVRLAEGGSAGSSAMDLSAIVRALGACYEMLQLRLYVRAGGPIEHVILEETLRALVGKSVGNIQDMVALAMHVYGSLPAKSADQGIVIVKPDQVAYESLAKMPSCVLAPGEGVYRSRLTANGGASGNRVTDDQLFLYRQTLGQAVDPQAGGHRLHDEDDLRTLLTRLHEAPGSTTAMEHSPD